MLPGFSYAEYNNLEDFASKVTPNTIGIMIEPVQGEGGVHPATQEFIEGLRKLCDEKDIVLMFDEVQTGWGRTGAPMAYMGYGVKPDIVSMAKAMGGGMPIGSMLHNKRNRRGIWLRNTWFYIWRTSGSMCSYTGIYLRDS